jgi:hypothetical protein
MSILAFDFIRYLPGRSKDQRIVPGESAPTASALGCGILQRNTLEAEVPDKRYWTAYDCYMIERDARAMRAAQLHAVLGTSWRALTHFLLGRLRG